MSETTLEGPEKTYEPHVIVVWASPTNVAVQEFPYKEDAEEKYNEILPLRGFQKVVLAKIVRKHGEG